jgi:hypothetical protein
MLGRRRFLDVLASLYIYNEHRGYTSIARVIEAVERKYPDAADFIGQVHKHGRDERKHYQMFRRYFELRGEMPYEVDRTCGHIDRLIGLTFGCTIEDLDTEAVVASDMLFNRLCRVIMLTEMRGMRQLDVLLRSPAVLSDPVLTRIFEIIRRDEPSHWQPYQYWLALHDGGQPTPGERAADWLVHKTLITVKLPLHYFNPALQRRSAWLDVGDDPHYPPLQALKA